MAVWNKTHTAILTIQQYNLSKQKNKLTIRNQANRLFVNNL